MEFFKANIIPGEVFVQLLAFLLLFGILKIFAWKPILNVLENRRQRIRKEFEDIEEAKKEIDRLKAEYADHLQKIESQARVMLQEAVNEGRTIAREIQGKARSDAQATLQQTKENLEIEIAKARLHLRQEIAEVALHVSERILREKMADDNKQRQKVLEIIEELEKDL